MWIWPILPVETLCSLIVINSQLAILRHLRLPILLTLIGHIVLLEHSADWLRSRVLILQHGVHFGVHLESLLIQIVYFGLHALQTLIGLIQVRIQISVVPQKSFSLLHQLLEFLASYCLLLKQLPIFLLQILNVSQHQGQLLAPRISLPLRLVIHLAHLAQLSLLFLNLFSQTLIFWLCFALEALVLCEFSLSTLTFLSQYFQIPEHALIHSPQLGLLLFFNADLIFERNHLFALLLDHHWHLFCLRFQIKKRLFCVVQFSLNLWSNLALVFNHLRLFEFMSCFFSLNLVLKGLFISAGLFQSWLLLVRRLFELLILGEQILNLSVELLQNEFVLGNNNLNFLFRLKSLPRHLFLHLFLHFCNFESLLFLPPLSLILSSLRVCWFGLLQHLDWRFLLSFVDVCLFWLRLLLL